MTAFKRKQIGDAETYRGHTIIVRFTGPDCICEVDGEDLPPFYVDAESARAGGRRHVDEVEKSKAAERDKATRTKKSA